MSTPLGCDFDKFLDSKIEEDRNTTIKTSYNPIKKNGNLKEDNSDITLKILSNIGTQMTYKNEEIKNEIETNNFKIIYTSELNIITKNNNNKTIIKEEKGLQTYNYYEDDEKDDISDINYKNIDTNSKLSNKKPNKKKIYNITKVFKKKPIMGRKTKRSGKIGKHNKYSIDNVIRKVKAKFIDSAFNYINNNFKNKNLFLLKIVGKQGKEINRNKILLWLKKTIKDVFYEDISKKNYNYIYNVNYNRELIDKIYLENEEQKVIEILNLSLTEFINLYCKKQKINGMKQLNEVLDELRLNGENEEYIKKFENISVCFESTIKNMKSRERMVFNNI